MRMKLKMIFLMSLLVLASCLPGGKTSLNELELKLAEEWMYSYTLQDFRLNGVVVERPPGISQFLFKMLLPADGGLSLKTHCVYYQVPYKQIPGKLTVEEYKNDERCPETSSGTSFLELDDLKNLKVTYEKFRLLFSFEKDKQKISWSFLLPNLEGNLIHEKYAPVKELKWKSGMTLLRVNADTFLNQHNKYLGKLNDRMSLGTAIRCEQVDKNCNIVGENRCGECRYGWYQVVDYQCPQGGSKFCGQNHCGEKGEPACPRGTKVVAEDELGICQSDLTPVWNADHILICQ